MFCGFSRDVGCTKSIDGTGKTNMAESKPSQKPYVFSVNNGMYDCESCVPKIKT